MAINAYDAITNQIIAALEAGVTPWSKSWTDVAGANGMPLRSTGEEYRGVNRLVLWFKQMERGYRSSRWVTYKQAEALGGHVRKGEKGTQVVFWKTGTREVETAEGTEDKKYMLVRLYTVFNLDQTEGIEQPAPVEAGPEREPGAVNVLAVNRGVDLRYGGNRAAFSPVLDYVMMPKVEQFADQVAHDATLAHELVHWTGHATRLDRTFGKRFGDDAYAAEELVAELGAAFVCGSLGLSVVPREDHAQYLAHWLRVLKADNRAIFTAASAAQAAADYLLAPRPDVAATSAA